MARCDLLVTSRSNGGQVTSAPPRPDITVNGKTVRTRQGNGRGWAMDGVDLRPWRGKSIRIRVGLPGPERLAFARPPLTLSACILADRPRDESEILNLMAAESDGPLPIGHEVRRELFEVLKPTRFAVQKPDVRITAEDLKSIRAAKLRIRVFDVNRQEKYAGKHLYLNGEKLCRIPPNPRALSAWDEVVLDLEPEDLRRIRIVNELHADNPPGDYFKFTGVTLSVQRADGRWAESTTEKTVHSSVMRWAHAEGVGFEKGRSKPFTLRFPAPAKKGK
jgi:hypothetical protein